MRMFLIAAVMTMSAGASCILVENEQIRAADLARSVRGLASLAPETVFGYAPQPGAMRVVSAQDIRRFAAANGVDVDTAEPVCVEYGVRVLERTDVEQAIRKVLEDGIELEVVDFTRAAVPRGELAFAKTGLLIPAEPSSEAVLWRGHVLYGQRSAAPIWARVRLTVTRTEVVAVRDLRPGAAIAEADIRLETRREPLSKRAGLVSTKAAEGMLPRRHIAAGTPIHAEWLRAPEVVRRGDQVPVTVVSASAVLRLHARAESNGRAGDRILLANLANGKRFEAVVDRRGEALLMVDGGTK